MMLARKQNMKRVLSSFLAMVMLLGLLPVSALGAGYENQVVSNGEEVSASDGKVVHSKMIKQTGTDSFDITLTVKTLEEIQQQTVSQDAAVVLVLDVSNSMDNKVDGKRKLSQAKEAAKAFVDSFVADAGSGKRMVSVVEFGSNAKTVSGWTEANGNADAVKNSISDVTIGFSYQSGGCSIEGPHTHTETQRQEVTKIVTPDQLHYDNGFWGWGSGWYCPECGERVSGNSSKNRPTENHECTTYEYVEVEVPYDGPHGGKTSTDSGGTNIEGGLRLANNLLSSSAVSGIGNTYVVLLTDGVPTYHVSDANESSSTTFMAGTAGGGDHATHEDYHDIYCTQKHATNGDNIPQQIKDKGAKLYTVAYDMTGNNNGTVNGTTAKNWMTAFSTQMIAADTNIFDGLGQVAEIIVNQAKAWILTDPMGEFINFVPDENSGVAVGTTEQLAGSDAVLQYNTDTKTLTWDLKSDALHGKQEGNYWVYTFTYSVTLDTANEDFDEDKEGGYPTNGTTTLTYMLTDDSGELQPDLQSTNLVVPVVKGKKPVVNYTINYWYKDKETGEYIKDETTNGSGKLWSTIAIDSGDYSKDNYRFANGPIGSQKLTKDGLVFDLYYDPIPAKVIVKHWVSTVDTTDQGEQYNAPELRGTDEYPDQYQGDVFTNSKFLDDGAYTQVAQVTVGETTYTTDDYTDVTLPEGTTTINIYYTAKGDDQRTPVDYEIHYWYREDSWQLNANGKYEKVTGTYTENEDLAVRQQDYHGVTITAPDKSSGVYTLDNDKTTATTMVLDKDKAENRLDIYYYKGASEEPTAEKATLTIKHVYKQQTINGLEEVTEDNWTEYENQTVYVGETWTATPDTKDGYTLETAQENYTVTITEPKHYEIVVEYCKDVREPVDIVVNHYYRTYTWTVDSATGEGSYVLTGSDKLENVHATGTWYVGQTYTPQQIPQGYTFDSSLSDGAKELTSGTNTFNLYYNTYVGSEADEADVTINHIYVTYSSYVDADGNVVRNEESSVTKSEATYYGTKGEVITAEKKEKDGFTFDRADTTDLKVTLQGKDGEYNLYYIKDDNQLGDSYAVTVQPIYKTYTTSVNSEGNVVTELTNTETGAPVALTGDFYAGQKVTALAADYGKTGFTYDPADADNTAGLTITVSSTGENVITVVYSKTENTLGLPVVVLVNNVYTTLTKYIDADGKLQTKESSFTSSNQTYGGYYVGQYFDTTGKGTQLSGYVADTREGITQPAASVKIEKDGQTVTFYWLMEEDQTVPATVKVVHHYTLKDANPNVGTTTWTVGADSEPLTGYFAGQFYEAGYDFQDGTFAAENVTEVVPGGATTDPGLELVAGLNEIHIYYEKSVDSRVSTSVKVIHNYYADAEAMAAGTTEATYEENINKLEADAFTATLRLENADLLYTFAAATPENYTIKVDKDASKNVITISYIRAETGYKVVHAYYTDDTLTGSTESTGTGKVGDVVNAADITKVTTYEGNTYTYTGADQETMTLGADIAANVITLRYDRSTYVAPSTRYTVTVNYYNQETGAKIAESHTERYISGSRYDVSEYDAIAIEGYTYAETTGDALSGTLDSDKTIDVWYTADEGTDIPEETTPLNPNPDVTDPGTDIPEEDTPLNPNPDQPPAESSDPSSPTNPTEPTDPGIDIPEDGTPLGDLPQTGTLAAPVNPAITAGLVALAFSMAGCGLYFTFGRKKGEEED